jgi:hypothetical protein
MTTTNETNYDAFDAGEAVQEQQLEAVGFRRLQHMNENTTYHRGSLIERGGYAIADDNGDAPDIGKSESVKHFGGGSTVMRVATEVELAVIGFSNKYFVAEYDDPAGTLDNFGKPKRVKLIVDRYMYPQDLAGPNGKCVSSISLFVVLKNDPKRELYELSFKSFNTDEGTKLINALKGYAGAVAQEIAKQRNKTTRLHVFALWMTLGVGETQMKGAKVQGPSTPPIWEVDSATPALMQRLVSGDDYRKFIELRKQLDEYLAQGRYSGVQQPQLPQRQAAPALAAPNQFDNAGNYARANGDVNI